MIRQAGRWWVALWFAAALGAQPVGIKKAPLRPPDLADVVYGPHERNVLDLGRCLCGHSEELPQADGL